jgi:hypothetical protein
MACTRPTPHRHMSTGNEEGSKTDQQHRRLATAADNTDAQTPSRTPPLGRLARTDPPTSSKTPPRKGKPRQTQGGEQSRLALHSHNFSHLSTTGGLFSTTYIFLLTLFLYNMGGLFYRYLYKQRGFLLYFYTLYT